MLTKLILLHLFIYLSTCLPIYLLPIYLSTYLPNYPTISICSPISKPFQVVLPSKWEGSTTDSRALPPPQTASTARGCSSSPSSTYCSACLPALLLPLSTPRRHLSPRPPLESSPPSLSPLSLHLPPLLSTRPRHPQRPSPLLLNPYLRIALR